MADLQRSSDGSLHRTSLSPRRIVEHVATIFFLAAAAGYPILFLRQGIDATDFAYWLVNYKFIFTDPTSVAFGMRCWLSVVIGGAWILPFGEAAAFGARIGYVFVIMATTFTVFWSLTRTLRFRPIHTAAALFVTSVAVAYVDGGALNWISYNDLSALFYAAATAFLLAGLNGTGRSSALLILIAGFVLGLNSFVRISNFPGFVLGAVIVFHAIASKSSLSYTARRMAVFASGWVMALVSAYLLMRALGHVEAVEHGLRMVFTDAGDSDGVHSLASLLGVMGQDLVDTILVSSTALVAFLIVLLTALPATLRLSDRRLLILVGVAGGAALTLWVLPHVAALGAKVIHVRWLWTYTGLVYVGLVCSILGFGPYRQRVMSGTPALAALIVLLLMPIGSGRSLLNATYALWFALPLVIVPIFQAERLGFGALHFPTGVSTFTKVCIATAAVLYCGLGNWRETYRDSSIRSELTTEPATSKFRGLLTTRERALAIDELANALPQYVRPGDPMLAMEYSVLAHYLGDTRPYLYNANFMYYSASLFDRAMEQARREQPMPPVLVTAKGSLDKQWPKEVIPETGSWPGFMHIRSEIANLMREHQYRKVWENVMFEIWTPGDLPPANRR